MHLFKGILLCHSSQCEEFSLLLLLVVVVDADADVLLVRFSTVVVVRGAPDVPHQRRRRAAPVQAGAQPGRVQPPVLPQAAALPDPHVEAGHGITGTISTYSTTIGTETIAITR